MSGAPRLNFDLQAQQGIAFLSQATEQVYGGAAGGGKSHLMRVASIVWSFQIPGLQTYLFRRTFPELKQNHLEGPTSYPVLLAAAVKAGRARIVKNEIKFRNGSRIYLRHCQYDRDVYNYQGAEFHVLMVDELTHWPESMYRYLRGRCRMTGIKLPAALAGRFPRVLCGTNPGNIGHHWVKEGWIEAGAYTVRQMPDEEGGMLRQFIPARLEDNPALRLADPMYEKKLEGLGDPLLVRAMREGDWDVVAGSQFGGVWRRDRHVCAPFALPQGWKIWRGGDDGYAAPTCMVWLTKDPDAGTIYVIGELYKAGMLPDEVAERTKTIDRLVELVGPYGQRLHNAEALGGVYDSAAFSDTGQASGGKKVESRGKQMNAMGLRLIPCDKGPGSRIHRAQNLHRLLAPNKKDPLKRPGIIFFDTCKACIRTIPTLPRDDKDPEDVDTEAEDHPYDAVTYAIQWLGGAFRRIRVA